MKFNKLIVMMGMASSILLSGCNSDTDATPPVVSKPEIPNFAVDGKLEVNIKRTTYGVPHITANNLESLAYGGGYVQAQDNLCILADGFTKANSERSKYFGPHASIDFNSGLPIHQDNGNIISDFAYKALKIRELAETNYSKFSDNSRALIEGYVAGYNQYLADIESGKEPNADLFCAGKPWVKPITNIDMATYIFSINILPGAANFLDLIFYANPGDGDEYLPSMKPKSAQFDPLLAQAFIAETKQKFIKHANTITLPEKNPQKLGSNGWGLGKEMTENGKGMVLVNPHFPFTGNLRFWQSHNTIPGHLDIIGGSLLGMPGLVNIGFNKDLAWTHTFSTSEHFVVYKHDVKSGDRMQYIVDGQVQDIKSDTVQIEVNVGNGQMMLAEKEVFYTDKGPIIEAPINEAPFGWDDGQVFMVQDVNMGNLDPLDHWLAMNRASNLDEFKQTFIDYDGMIFLNTMYADKEGNAFFIDDASVPGLNDFAVAMLKQSEELQALRELAGFTVLPGNSVLFAFDGPTPYENVPKMTRSDFVQNSNDSHWSTNLAQPLEGFSPMFGEEREQLSLRTRMGLKMLQDGAGEDGKFSLAELEQTFVDNRIYLAEMIGADLIKQCQAQGSTPVKVTETISKDISAACQALQAWQGSQNRNAVGASLWRELAYLFDQKQHLTTLFDANQAATTPNQLVNDNSALVLLARAALNVEASGFKVDDPLGTLQFVESSTPTGLPSGTRFSWPGSYHQAGGFNVFSNSTSRDDTLIPQYVYKSAIDPVTNKPLPSGLSTSGYPIRYGSSWIMAISFTDEGPVARGILTYSQSTNNQRAESDDQTEYFSLNNSLRPVLFTPEEIEANLQSEINLSTTK